MELFRKRKKENEPEEAALIAEQAAEPEATEPEMAEPELAEPEATEPEAEPEVDEPEAAEPIDEPEAAEPVDEPEMAEERPLTLAALLETLSPEGVEIFRKALADAEVRGRNTAVEEHLIAIDDSDGVPHPGCGQGASIRSQPASIFDLARMARR